jgi:hypothetical protein
MHYFVRIVGIALLSATALSGCYSPVAAVPPAYDDVTALRYAYPYSLPDYYYPYYGSVYVGRDRWRSDHHDWAQDR